MILRADSRYPVWFSGASRAGCRQCAKLGEDIPLPAAAYGSADQRGAMSYAQGENSSVKRAHAHQW